MYFPSFSLENKVLGIHQPLNLFSAHFALFSLTFPVFCKEKRAKCAEKGLDYQILPYLRPKDVETLETL